MFSKKQKEVLSIFLILFGLILLYAIVDYLPFLSTANKVILGLVAMIAIGLAVSHMNSFEGFYGIYLLGSRVGIKTIDSISKRHRNFWTAMATWGLVLSFGLLVVQVTKTKISKKMMLFGMFSIFAIFFLVEYFGIFGLSFISILKIPSSTSPSFALTAYSMVYVSAMLASIFVFGFSGLIIFLLLLNASSIISSISILAYSSVIGKPNMQPLQSQIAGVAPVLPGITIPLAAGIISLAILLVIHEASHGILSRIYGVKLKRTGLVLFGSIPVGAFVEPAEEQIKKLKKAEQTKIYSAGVSMNFIATVFFLILLVPFIYLVLPHLYSTSLIIAGTMKNYPAYGVIPNGSVIEAWNNIHVSNLSSLEEADKNVHPGMILNITANNKTYQIKTIASPYNSSKGEAGVYISERESVRKGYGLLNFFYSVVALSFLLNFFVAVSNLLPIPGFDGWQIYHTNIKHKSIPKILGIIVVCALLINIIPLFV
ncbi:MAG: site-2 protease family protein [Candidatus Micrarchaeia archaeon]